MLDPRFALPPNLPVPIDDGAADHLIHAPIPPLALPSTRGDLVSLASLPSAVVFFYPRTGVPDEPPGPEWDAIPGARGCTPQSCAFRDRHAQFTSLGVPVFALSTQTTDYQREFVARMHIPFPILSDASLQFTRAMKLPTFEYDSGPFNHGCPTTLIKRMAWYIARGRVQCVWYPVFPPDQCADIVLEWLQQRSA